jgi:hypothetical protein
MYLNHVRWQREQITETIQASNDGVDREMIKKSQEALEKTFQKFKASIIESIEEAINREKVENPSANPLKRRAGSPVSYLAKLMKKLDIVKGLDKFPAAGRNDRNGKSRRNPH